MISISNLHFNYTANRPILKNVELQLKPGNIYGLLGKNGVGKSTLLRLINGLIFPKNGQCEIDGFNSADRNPDLLKEIYFVPEENYPISLTILEHLYTYAPFYPRFNYDQFFKLISGSELDGSRKIESLSHGQKKKVLLAFAVATNTKILLLDEPTNGLDIPSKAQFRNLITDAMLEDRIIIISTHQVRDMVNLIDPIIIVDEGKILFHQSVEEISKQLKFEVVHSLQAPTDCIYSERIAGGYMSIKKNDGLESANIDIEILFNAILSNRQSILNAFQS